MIRRDFFHTLGGSLLTLPLATHAADTKPVTATAPPELIAKLEEIRKKHNVPSLAAAKFDPDGIRLQGATGFRKAGGTKPVTTEDIWHIGSMTKAMTATLLATYVEQGRLKWEDTLGKLIPSSCKGAAAWTKDITVRQLLQHRSGLPANLPDWWALPEASQRGKVLALAAPENTAQPKPGTFLYSNAGYAIAGHVAEKLDQGLWEKLIQTRLFAPLKIIAGQGPAGTEGKDDQPWPHDANGKPLATNGLRSDNAPSLGPAGRVHTSMAGYARFAADHLRGAKGGKALLKQESYQTLHAPDPESHYACGWGIAARPWAGGRCLTHTGSNNANYFAAWLAPEKAFGVLAVTNQGGPAAGQACDEACSLLIES